MRSDSDKEKTKMRERQRRAITTKIFQGLRKHGGYHLSPRADINQVLRELAKESGWTIMPDGTTFRSKASNGGCPVCAITPTTSSVVNTGGECSTTTTPRPLDPAFGEEGGYDSTYYLSSGGDGNTFYNMYTGTGGAGIQFNPSDVSRVVGDPHHQQPSNQTVTQPPAGN